MTLDSLETSQMKQSRSLRRARPNFAVRCLAGLLAIGLVAGACSTSSPSATDEQDQDSEPTQSEPTDALSLSDDGQVFSLRLTQPELATSVEIDLVAPETAAAVQVSTDPSFQNAVWSEIGPLDHSVASTGVQELFVRYRDDQANPVGETSVSAFTLDGPLTPLTGDEANPEHIRVTRVSADVIQVDFEIGEVENREGEAVLIEGPDLRAANWSLDDFEVAVDDNSIELVDFGRITEPTGQIDGDTYSLRHQFHLRSSDPIPNGELSLSLPDVPSPVRASIGDREWSPAVHTSHLGWASGDNKRAFVSVWTTMQDPIDVGNLRGEIVDADGATVFAVDGEVFVPDNRSEFWRGDLSGGPTASFTLDDLSETGTYRFCVEAIGCSHSFEITDAGPWAPVMSTVARALFHQRSGLDLEQPYTAFERPRAHHPDDGQEAIASTQSLFEDANGRGDGERFVELVAGSTDETVPDAWGGHFDAGDWDRRIQHLWVVRRIVDLVEQFDNIAEIELQIPESGDSTPDLLDEALWSIDAYRRLQLPNGAIRGGIESADHPLEGTTSWDDPLDLFVYAPDAWSSWTYVWAAADAAYVLDRYDTSRATELRDSAVRAMEWAESELAAGRVDLEADADLTVQRTNAAASLYRTTEDEQWNELYAQTSPIADGEQRISCTLATACEGAWRYATLPDHLGDDTIRANAVASIISAADRLSLGAETTAYGWNIESNDVELFFGLGPSNAHSVTLMRAFLLTDEARYREQAVLNAQFALGANPSGATWITGVGFDNPDRIVGVDQQNGGIPVWPGTPVYGVVTPNQLPNWYVEFWLRPSGMTPDPLAWPALQGFIDVGVFPGQAEFTVQQSHGEAIWTFGALAGTAG